MTAPQLAIDASQLTACRLKISGRVQGVGMRPAMARLAQQCGLSGFVHNTRSGVEIHIEGTAASVDCFIMQWKAIVPEAAHVVASQHTFCEPLKLTSFRIRPPAQHADPSSVSRDLSTLVPADVVTCPNCLTDIHNAHDRRFAYPFTSCTACGPRYSLVERMPFERSQTSMWAFPLCEACQHEYETADDRRFHAQTVACPHCGPHLWFCDSEGRQIAQHQQALTAATAALREGWIVALLGLGGYQLLADATSQTAVERLRQRKGRRGKPLAIMVRSLEQAATLATLDAVERRQLTSPAGPIVVVGIRTPSPLAHAVSGDLNTVGLMLPTTPLHHLLLKIFQAPLVCTSGNREGEPLAFELAGASASLQGLADYRLEHNRPIVRPVDDSVIRVMAGRPVSIRLARGLAPLPLDLSSEHQLLALGGQQKNALALHNGSQCILGPHLGDLGSVATCERWERQQAALGDLYGLENPQLVCDLHPDYFTTLHAEQTGGKLTQVKHHHAHIVAGMLEHKWLDRQVLGVAFDGTGWGTDGTIWGGEFLKCKATQFERVGHLRPFRLPGGEQAIRQPWRVWVSLVADALDEDHAAQLSFPSVRAHSLLPLLKSKLFSPHTTSAGRLFDGVAAWVLGVDQVDFEGQAAMLLEACCDLSETGCYEIPLQTTQPWQLDWRPLVRSLWHDQASGTSPGRMAMRFHRGLAFAIFQAARQHADLPIVLGGGVFQNRILVELIQAYFASTPQPLGIPGLIPPNDGGLAAGQLAVAAAKLRQERTNSCV